MATFCTKCGAALTPENEFCPMCGAPANAPVTSIPPSYQAPDFAPVPPPAQQAWQAPPPYSGPTPAPAASGSSALKVILIIVAIFVGLGILGAAIFGYSVYRLSKAVHVENSGDKVTVHTAGGTISTDSSQMMSGSDLGVDPYPGARSGHGSMKMDLPNGSMHTGIFITDDPAAKVIEFYKSKFGNAASTMETPSGALITLTKGNEESIIVTVTSGSSENEGKTQISIVHTKSSKAS